MYNLQNHNTCEFHLHVEGMRRTFNQKKKKGIFSSFSHNKLKCLGPTYFTVRINFTMFSLTQEKSNDILLPLYIFLKAMHLNLKAKGQFDMSN